jgi:hypothetical protein
MFMKPSAGVAVEVPAASGADRLRGQARRRSSAPCGEIDSASGRCELAARCDQAALIIT